MNKHVEQYLNYFLGLPVSPNYAVMVTGQWGAGKTQLVRNVCEAFDGADLKVYYISLYGLSSTKQIDDLVFACLHPVLSNKKIKAGAKVLMSALKLTTSLNLDMNAGGNKETTASASVPQIDLSAFISDDEKKSKSVFIFDDFERCSMAPKEVLGYINYYVEHLGAKVLIISNPEKFEGDVGDAGDVFFKLKEKVIGQELHVIADFDGAFDTFVLELLSDEECKESIATDKDNIKRIFNEAGYNNLRALRNSLLQFSRFYKVLPGKAKSHTQFISELIEDFFPLSFEYLNGADLRLLEYRSLIGDNADFTKQFNKYENFEILKVVTHHSDLWKNFFIQGFLDNDLLKAYIESNHLFETDTTADWIKLWNWRYLTSDSFLAILSSIQSKLDNKQIIEAGEILHIFGSQMLVVSLGFEFKSINQIYQEGRSYIDSIRKEITFNVFAEDSLGMRSYGGFGYPEDLKELQELFNYSKNLKKELTEESYPEQAAQFLTKLKENNTNGLCELFDYSGLFAKFPVFKYIKSEDVMDVLAGYQTTESWRNFIRYLGERKEKLTAYKCDINDEMSFYRELKDFLDDYVSKTNKTLITSIGAKLLLNKLNAIIDLTETAV